jgi:hypothetical protein
MLTPSRRAALGPIGPPPCLCQVDLPGANLRVVDADVDPAFGKNFSWQKISAAGL